MHNLRVGLHRRPPLVARCRRDRRRVHDSNQRWRAVTSSGERRRSTAFGVIEQLQRARARDCRLYCKKRRRVSWQPTDNLKKALDVDDIRRSWLVVALPHRHPALIARTCRSSRPDDDADDSTRLFTHTDRIARERRRHESSCRSPTFETNKKRVDAKSTSTRSRLSNSLLKRRRQKKQPQQRLLRCGRKGCMSIVGVESCQNEDNEHSFWRVLIRWTSGDHDGHHSKSLKW